MQKRTLSLGGNSVIPAIVNGVSKLCGLAKAALAEGAGTAPIVRAVSCYETRRASQRDREVHPLEEPRAKDLSECKEDRKMAESREQREPARRRSNRQTQALSSSFFSFCFSPFVSWCARLLFLLLLSFARVLPCRGPCRVKTTYVLGEAPGSRSVASRPLPSSLLFNDDLSPFSFFLFLLALYPVSFSPTLVPSSSL